MNFRTDLTIELIGDNQKTNGIENTEEKIGETHISRTKIKNEEAAEKLNKPIGKYVTIEIPNLTEYISSTDNRIKIISKEIKSFIGNSNLTLIVGLGNPDITPDALGPKVINNILVTRHIKKDFYKTVELKKLNSVAAISLNVLGKTGIESQEILLSIVKKIKPDYIIIVDAMASKSLNRLGNTIQISDTGICPGSGVGNARPKINEESLGVPVIGIGVPTVVDVISLLKDSVPETFFNENIDALKSKLTPNGNVMVVTPRDVDMLINRASTLISMGINYALHPNFSIEDLHALVC